jgi:hypothetical protein
VFKDDRNVIHTTETINENMDHGQDLMFDCMIICKHNKWTAYRASGGFGPMVEMKEG